jgi:hypothetical protein
MSPSSPTVELLNIIQAQTTELQQPDPSSPPKNRSSENEREESKPREHRRTPLEIDTTQRLCMDRSVRADHHPGHCAAPK